MSTESAAGRFPFTNSPDFVANRVYSYPVEENPITTSRANIYKLKGEIPYVARVYTSHDSGMISENMLAHERIDLFEHYITNRSISPEVYLALTEVLHLPDEADKTFSFKIADPVEWFQTLPLEKVSQVAIIMKELDMSKN